MIENKRRQLLKKAMIFSILLMISAFLFVIFQGLLWSPKLSQEETYETLAKGETRLFRRQQKRYWVTKLTDKQREQLLQLAQFVHENTGGCSIKNIVCELDATSQRSGVLIQFVSLKPTQLPVTVQWFGGFIDPATGGIYDLLGRAYISNPEIAQKHLSAKPN